DAPLGFAGDAGRKRDTRSPDGCQHRQWLPGVLAQSYRHGRADRACGRVCELSAGRCLEPCRNGGALHGNSARVDAADAHSAPGAAPPGVWAFKPGNCRADYHERTDRQEHATEIYHRLGVADRSAAQNYYWGIWPTVARLGSLDEPVSQEQL